MGGTDSCGVCLEPQLGVGTSVVFVHGHRFEVVRSFYVMETLGEAGETVQVSTAIVEIGPFRMNWNSVGTGSPMARRSAGQIGASVGVTVESAVLLVTAKFLFGL